MTIDTDRQSTRLLWILLTVELLLVVLDAVITYGQLSDDRYFRRLFNITREDSIPSWFSSMQFLLISLLLWLIYFRAQALALARWRQRCWAVVAVGFLYLSLDDGSRLHERVGSWAAHAFQDPGTLLGALVQGNPSYTWHVILGPLFLLGGLFVIGFAWRELRISGQRAWFAAGIACFVVSQGLDFLEGIDAVVEQLGIVFGVSIYTLSHFSKSTEEFIEMLGQTLLLVAFFRHLGQLGGDYQLARGRRAASPQQRDCR